MASRSGAAAVSSCACCGPSGRCTGRSFLLVICTLQLISCILRQVIDFLGQMWLPILFDFFATIFTLIGFFGIYYTRPTHLSLYILFQLISLSWNSFVMAFYMEIPPLSRESELLNLGTGSRSWWELNGPFCQPQYNVSSDYSYEPWYRPVHVHGCLVPFFIIETAQAITHFILSMIAFFMSLFLLISSCIKQQSSATLRPGASGRVVPSLPSHYSISMSYNPQATNTMSSRGTSHRRSVSSLPGHRRSMNRGKRSRSSTRSTASARRRKRIQRANHRQSNMSFDPTTDEYGYASSVYQSQNQLISSHYDASSLDSFNPNGGHTNPLYGGSVQSAGSRFSLYTINPQATMERITVNDHPGSSTSSATAHHTQQKQENPKQHPATISRHHRPYLRPRSPIYMNSNETVM